MCKLILDDSRRLTGKSMVWDYPGAILDTFVSGIDKQQVVECWQQNIQTILQAVGWLKEKTSHRIFADGISFLLSAPLDCLYAATEINEAAWDLCCAKLQNKVMHESSKKLIERLKKLIHVESNPQLLNFISQAEAAKVPWLLDDDEITLG